MKKPFILAFVFVIIMLTLTMCASIPDRCAATESIKVYRTTQEAETVDTLEPGEKVIVTGKVGNLYEVTTARLVDGYVEAGKCK